MKLAKNFDKAWTFLVAAVVALIGWLIIILENIVNIGQLIPPELLGETGLAILTAFATIVTGLRMLPQKNMQGDSGD